MQMGSGWWKLVALVLKPGGVWIKVQKIGRVQYDLVESYPSQHRPRWVWYQIQFIPRLGLESVGLGWLDRYSELTWSTQKKKTINRFLAKETHHIKNQNFQRFLYKRKPVKIWNKPVTLSKAFKKRHDWRITYLTLNPPLSECWFFIFGALSVPQRWLDVDKATLLSPIVTLLHPIVWLWLYGSSGKVRVIWKATDHGLRSVLGKKIVRL